MRHACASLAVLAGASVKALQRMLGHASAKKTLDTDADPFDSDLDSVAVALDNAVTRIRAVKTQSKVDLSELLRSETGL
jgi:integrase